MVSINSSCKCSRLFVTLKEEEESACSDGVFDGKRYFTCPKGRGFFTLLQHCQPDSRFTSNKPNSDTSVHGVETGELFRRYSSVTN